MYRFSRRSKDRLGTCHPELVRLMEGVMDTQLMDFTIIEGHRSVERQQRLYAQGRTKPGSIVTHINGLDRMGMHNYNPSLAVDIAPWLINKNGRGYIAWRNIKAFKELALIVKTTAHHLDIAIEWGGDWQSFKDYPHYQLSRNTKFV